MCKLTTGGRSNIQALWKGRDQLALGVLGPLKGPPKGPRLDACSTMGQRIMDPEGHLRPVTNLPSTGPSGLSTLC